VVAYDLVFGKENIVKKMAIQKKNNTLTCCVLALSCWLNTSCSTDHPVPYRTGELYAVINVSADDTHFVSVQAQFTKNISNSSSHNSKQYVEIRSPNWLFASPRGYVDEIVIGNEPFKDVEALDDYVALSSQKNYGFNANSPAGKINYNEFWQSGQVKATEESLYFITLWREKTHVSAHSQVKLPLKFNISRPSALDSFSRSENDILVEWSELDSSVASVLVSVDSLCSTGAHKTYQQEIFGDNGNFVVAAGALKDDLLIGNCTATLRIEKTNFGELDSHFYGGFITGTRITQVRFTTTD
jgi:hypothetical protein